MNEKVKVFRCTTCLNMSTRPRIGFDAQGRCNACVWSERKQTIDWSAREKELVELLAKHKRTDGGFDCVVPVSGGKDGSYVAYNLKHKYGMNPLAVTVTPAPVATVTVTPSPGSVRRGSTLQLTATLRDANGNVLTGRTVSWSTSAPAIATVTPSSGVVTGVTTGTATITALSEGKTGTSVVTVTPP